MTSPISIIPKPQSITPCDGYFSIPVRFVISAPPELDFESRYLRDTLQSETDIPAILNAPDLPETIVLNLEPGSKKNAEAYHLSITPQKIVIRSGDKAGVFYGIQSLLQYLQHFLGEERFPCAEIEDAPRFAWRGFMLDEGRHFHGREQVERLLDIMARYKMNIFHWHLTEDQGWRIEIKGYPRLTEIGSKRAGTRYSFTGKKHNHIPHSGFYTQEEIREIVAYAAERHISVVPEIDIPGHSLAALTAYPEFSCTGGPFEVATKPGIFPELYCAGKESTFTFLENIFEEIIALFPAEYIHIGGDEAPKKRWSKCPDCQRRAQEQGLDAKELQVYFTNRVVNFLSAKAKRVIGWSEILQPGLAEDALVQYWLPQPKKIVQAIQSKQNVLISPVTQAYLDQTYDLISLNSAYAFEPVFEGLSDSEADQIIGLEAPLWSEYVWNQERLDYQVFPRLLAYAETGWTLRQNKNYADFETRLRSQLPWLDAIGIAHAPEEDWNPAAWKQKLGLLSIAQAKNQTAEGKINFPA